MSGRKAYICSHLFKEMLTSIAFAAMSKAPSILTFLSSSSGEKWDQLHHLKPRQSWVLMASIPTATQCHTHTPKLKSWAQWPTLTSSTLAKNYTTSPLRYKRRKRGHRGSLRSCYNFSGNRCALSARTFSLMNCSRILIWTPDWPTLKSRISNGCLLLIKSLDTLKNLWTISTRC